MPIVSTFCAGTHREPLSNSHALDVVPVAHSTRLRVDLESIPKLVETGATPSSGDGM